MSIRDVMAGLDPAVSIHLATSCPGDHASHRSRDAIASESLFKRYESFASNGREAIFQAPLKNEGGGAPNGAPR